MRILTGLTIAALLATAAPAFAQATTETPAAPAAEAPAAQAPADAAPAAAPKAPTPAPEGVSDEADKLLWCGNALSFASGFAKEAGDEESATAMLDNGGKLIDKGVALLTDVAPDRIDAIKAAAYEEMSRAFDVAKAASFPPAEFAYTDVQDAGDPRQGAF